MDMVRIGKFPAELRRGRGSTTGCLMPIPARIIAYNKMSAYVEYKAFDV